MTPKVWLLIGPIWHGGDFWCPDWRRTVCRCRFGLCRVRRRRRWARLATTADGSVCAALPAETSGPLPADGTNVREAWLVNILIEAGVVCEDIRSLISRPKPVVGGVPVMLEMTLQDAGRGWAPLAAHAIHLGQSDVAGVYSVHNTPDRNYLRGVAISGGLGRVRFIIVLSGCYPGRSPYLHF